MSNITSHLRANTGLFMHEFETITHNLANANTPGFKRSSLAFTAALDSQQQKTGMTSDSPLGPLQIRQQLDFTQGKLNHTGRPLDLALSGPGFFTIDTPQGPVYTRNGVFQVDGNGQLVDTEGHTVSGEGGQPITVPPTADLNSIEVGPDGRVKVGTQAIGQLRLATFPDQEDQLTSAGAGSFRAPAGIEPSTAEGTLVSQGYQEASNVDTVREMVDMMSVSRLYEANMKFITAKRDASQSLMQLAMG